MSSVQSVITGSEALSLFSSARLDDENDDFHRESLVANLFNARFFFCRLIARLPVKCEKGFRAGLFPSKPGKARASNNLLSPFGLAFRLQRTAFISWAVGMLLLGISYGSVLGDLDSFFQGNEMVEKILVQEEGYSIAEQFISIIMTVMGMIATIPALISMNKLYGEEKKSRLELLYAKPVSRKTMMGS